jgi:hypothetical protein
VKRENLRLTAREAAEIEWNFQSLMPSNFNRRFGDISGLREIYAKAID